MRPVFEARLAFFYSLRLLKLMRNFVKFGMKRYSTHTHTYILRKSPAVCVCERALVNSFLS